MSKKPALILTILLLFLFSVIYYIFLETKNYDSKIFPGIYVADFYVGGLSKEQAEAKLSASIHEYLKEPIVLFFKDKKWHFYPENYIRFDLKESIDQAFLSGRKKFFLYNYITIIKYKKNPVYLALSSEFKDNAPEDIFSEIQKNVYAEPKDAYFKINGDRIDIVNEIPGEELDLEDLKKKLLKHCGKEIRLSMLL